MNTYGSATNFVSNQISYNNDKINSLNAGWGHWWTPTWRRKRRCCRRCRSSSSLPRSCRLWRTRHCRFCLAW
jgi:hypothetical protein